MSSAIGSSRCRAVLPLMLLLGVAGTAPAQQAATPRAVLEKYGALGTWATDCDGRASPDNAYTVYRALDDGRVQYDTMDGPTHRAEFGVVESAVEAGPQDFQLTRVVQNNGREYRDVMTIRIEGNHRRVMERVTNGKQQIAAGRYLDVKDNGALRGKSAPWYNRCE
jgi:hypothetical protein